ncbi:hypothetical protein Y032_0357g3395 [Ancylostoma ceylanicum]|uniref:Uncharacterized protein n=1 Tax=Ancylostoma ceylanicum TaxID=53326 RepID=A0A016RW35_9BILA|nr:hypothetical protein Y032_0357g3395 [Ancylostoma ceylanicum]
MGVDCDGLSAASKSTRRDRTAYDGIVSAVTNLGFLHSCSSLLVLTDKKTKQLSRKPDGVVLEKIAARAVRSRCLLFEAAEWPPPSTPTLLHCDVWLWFYWRIWMALDVVYRSEKADALGKTMSFDKR